MCPLRHQDEEWTVGQPGERPITRRGMDATLLRSRHGHRPRHLPHRQGHSARRTRPRSRGQGLPLAVVPRALAHPGIASYTLGWAGGCTAAARGVLAHARPVPRPGCRCSRHHVDQVGHGYHPGGPARSAVAGEGGGHARPVVERSLPVRRRVRLEPRGDGEPRRRHRPSPQGGARKDPGLQGTVDPRRGQLRR